MKDFVDELCIISDAVTTRPLDDDGIKCLKSMMDFKKALEIVRGCEVRVNIEPTSLDYIKVTMSLGSGDFTNDTDFPILEFMMDLGNPRSSLRNQVRASQSSVVFEGILQSDGSPVSAQHVVV